MLSFAYISALAGAVIFGGIQITMYTHMGRFYGRTLSQWIEKTRHKTDDYSAEKLIYTQKNLEVLAHDVLKHRLLGLASLTQELRKKTADGKKLQDLTQDRINDISSEIFRLCGVKNTAEQRLWTRFRDCFLAIFKQTSVNTAVPPIDPMFSETLRKIMALRGLLVNYVDREDSRAEFLTRFMNLQFDSCTQLYTDVLDMAAGCRMIVEPDILIQKSLGAVSAQTRRASVQDLITVYPHDNRLLLCTASTDTIVMCLTRLLDNALELGKKVGISVEIDTDDFTGISSIVFKIYDTSESIPAPSSYGIGIRGISQTIARFEGGFQFHATRRDEFKKAAILTFPVFEFKTFSISKVKPKTILGFASLGLISLLGFLFCLLYVLGGPPVEFAGNGQNIIEFSVKVGEELNIPLCTGGRNVRAEAILTNESCTADGCSFASVLSSLRPCEISIDNPECPGAIQWIPQFNDGQRQGKIYELSVHCISEGPPASDDLRRIRVLVSRPNSNPKLLLAQVLNKTRGDVQYVQTGKTILTGVTDQLILRAVATDDDADLLTYRLRLPNGKSLTSADGTFLLDHDWSLFATATFELEITDGIAPPIKLPVVLEADTLHPIELKSISFWDDNALTKRACDGTGDARVCQSPDALSQIFEIQIWFDPLQPQIRPSLSFQAAETPNYDIRPVLAHPNTITQIGDQWEIYSTQNHQLVSVIELTNIEKLSAPGLYTFMFRSFIIPNSTEVSSLAVNLTVTEISSRLPELKSLIIFSKPHLSRDFPITLSASQTELTEFESDDDASQAKTSTWIYPNKNDTCSLKPTVGNIVCQTPEFAEAFEPPVIREINNTWRLDLALKRGCIPGLTESMPAKARICAADIHIGDEQNRTEPFWITLKSRPCSPQLQSLTLTSTKEELAENRFKWSFRIIDPDGDLQQHNISVSGITDYTLQITPMPQFPGNVYDGELTFSSTCENPAFTPDNAKISLQIRDDDNHLIAKTISPQLNCPPLVNTQNKLNSFKVDDGSHISIPLHFDRDVQLSLNSRFGHLTSSSFEWDASCLYGSGPHTVEIRTTAPNRYGNPLQFRIEVQQCQPRFEFLYDGTSLSINTPIILPVHSEHRIKITSSQPISRFSITPRSSETLPHVTLNQRDENAENAWHFTISCDKSGALENLSFQILPSDDSALNIDPIRFPIHCISTEDEEDTVPPDDDNTFY